MLNCLFSFIVFVTVPISIHKLGTYKVLQSQINNRIMFYTYNLLRRKKKHYNWDARRRSCFGICAFLKKKKCSVINDRRTYNNIHILCIGHPNQLCYIARHFQYRYYYYFIIRRIKSFIIINKHHCTAYDDNI